MDHSPIMRHINLLLVAQNDLKRRPVRSIVMILCMATILFPLVTALAISEGLRSQAEIAVEQGPDLYISGDVFGLEGPISTNEFKKLSDLNGISHKNYRVVGRTYFQDHLVVVVGLNDKALSALTPLVEGNIPRKSGEVLIGQGIAKTFGIQPGKGMRFTLPANPRKVLWPTGALASTCLWGSDIMIMQIEDANRFFRMPDHATQLLLYGDFEPNAAFIQTVEERLHAGNEIPRPFHIVDRRVLLERLQRGYGHKGGIFIVLFVISGALAIPGIWIFSGFGFKELERETGVLKATGWQTRDVLEKTIFETLLISLCAMSLAILFSMTWIKGFNGILLAQFFIAEVGLIPRMDIPCRYLPSHWFFCLLFVFGISTVGISLSARHMMRKDLGI